MRAIGPRGPGANNLLGTPRTGHRKKRIIKNNSRKEKKEGNIITVIIRQCIKAKALDIIKNNSNNNKATYMTRVLSAMLKAALSLRTQRTSSPFTHTNTPLTTHTQSSQHPLGTPTHGPPVADTGIEQADEGHGLTPPLVQGQPKQNILRANIHSHPQHKRKGSAKGHHKRHTYTHTQQVAGEGFAFTRPCQDIHKQIGHNIPQEPMRFTGQCIEQTDESPGLTPPV